jgi:hypothetical protein
VPNHEHLEIARRGAKLPTGDALSKIGRLMRDKWSRQPYDSQSMPAVDPIRLVFCAAIFAVSDT